MKYCNLMYPEVVKRCAEERLWIKQYQTFYGPYDWAWEYGISFRMVGWQPVTANPFQLLEEGMRVIEKDPTNQRQIDRYNHFFARVRDYYLAGKDEKMLKSLETGIWVE